MTRRFIAVDLDGTLAYYDQWRGRHHIGEPIPAMVTRVKHWLEDGHAVIIFTSRTESLDLVEAWCLEHLGQVLPITNVKHSYFSAIYDDRAVSVEKNTGRLLSVERA